VVPYAACDTGNMSHLGNGTPQVPTCTPGFFAQERNTGVSIPPAEKQIIMLMTLLVDGRCHGTIKQRTLHGRNQTARSTKTNGTRAGPDRYVAPRDIDPYLRLGGRGIPGLLVCVAVGADVRLRACHLRACHNSMGGRLAWASFTHHPRLNALPIVPAQINSLGQTHLSPPTEHTRPQGGKATQPTKSGGRLHARHATAARVVIHQPATYRTGQGTLHCCAACRCSRTQARWAAAAARLDARAPAAGRTGERRIRPLPCTYAPCSLAPINHCPIDNRAS
jgi:hypothetical protein